MRSLNRVYRTEIINIYVYSIHRVCLIWNYLNDVFFYC